MNINFIPIKPFSIRNIQLIFILSFTLLFACGQKQTQLPEPETNKTPNTETVIAKLHPYIEKGDFQTLQQRGVIRLLIPRFDSTQELPRHGLPVQAYQALAERFVESLNLTPQWIFVDSFDSLLSDLKAGKGDLVITNLSVTAQREQHAKFSLALTAIDEVLIIHKDTNANSLDALNGLTITIPVGTAYEETLTKLKKQHPDLIIELNKNNLSDTQLLQQIDTGKITATVIDSDVANLLLPLYPLLRKGPTLKKNRPIAWAVRKNNLQLQRLLNEFLVAEHIQSNRNQAIHRDWEQIKANKKIRMLTLNNPSSYFMWRGELMGFDYDLMQEFARQHQLRLEVIVKNNINDLLEALQQGEGDLIAASLSVTPERAAAGVIFSRRYMSIREQLISLASEPAIETIEQLAGKRVAVNPQTSFYPRLLALKNQGIDFQIVTKPGIATEVLINGLNDGDYEFTVADSHLASIEQSYRNDLRINLDLSEDVEIAWGLRADQPELVKTLNAFIKKQYRGLFYNVTFKKYFVSTKNIHRHKKYRVTTEGALSPFDNKIKQLSKAYTFDWRLITAQIYQESKFNPKAVSFAGAEGLMQVMPRTAQQLGYSNLHDPDNAISAGLAYMDWLHGRFPGNMSVDERLYFVLAAYNAGAGHVRDAKRLAQQLGKDPKRWFDHVEHAMLLLAKPEYAKKARFGYVRGSEPVNYVRSIRDRYLAYLNIANINNEKKNNAK